MRKPVIYIAASWRHQHAVEMLTTALRINGYEVKSFVENNYGEGHSATKPMPFEDWMRTEAAVNSFIFDTESAMRSDAVIYIGDGGKDAAAECGMAYAKGVPLYGLWAKGEDFGLMRKMFSRWFEHWHELIDHVRVHHPANIIADYPQYPASSFMPLIPMQHQS